MHKIAQPNIVQMIMKNQQTGRHYSNYLEGLKFLVNYWLWELWSCFINTAVGKFAFSTRYYQTTARYLMVHTSITYIKSSNL